MKCSTDYGSNHCNKHTSLQITHLCYLNYCDNVVRKTEALHQKRFFLIVLLEVQKQCWPSRVFVFEEISRHLPLHQSDEGLNELDERLLTFLARLGARRGGFGLGGGEDAAGRRRRRTSAEVPGKAREESALVERERRKH